MGKAEVVAVGPYCIIFVTPSNYSHKIFSMGDETSSCFWESYFEWLVLSSPSNGCVVRTGWMRKVEKPLYLRNIRGLFILAMDCDMINCCMRSEW